MIHTKLESIQNEKAHLLARLNKAEIILKKKRPRIKTTIKPITKTNFILHHNKHLQNNSVKKSDINAFNNNRQSPIHKKKGRGYHTINNFNRRLSPETYKGSMMFCSSLDKNASRFRLGRQLGTGNNILLNIIIKDLRNNLH